MPSSWLAASLVVALVARTQSFATRPQSFATRPQSFATRDELALIETLARDGFADLARARLESLAPRLAPAELPLARVTRARVTRSAATRAATPAERLLLLRGAIAALNADVAPAAGAPPPPESLRLELIAALRDLAAALASDGAADPEARKGAVDALREARRELEALFEQRKRSIDAMATAPPPQATVDAWLPVLDAARLCFDEAGLLPPGDPQHAGRLRSAREQADQFASKIGAASLRTLDARLLAGRAAFELGDFDECAARMQALFDAEAVGAALDLVPDVRSAAAQTWFDALAAAAAAGGARERAALHEALPRLETLGANGAVFLLAVDEFDAASATTGAAAERIVRLESALLWLRLVGAEDPDRDRALLLTARATLALAAAGHATFGEALAPLDALASRAASHPPADPGRAELRERVLLEADFDRGTILVALGRADAALAVWRPLAKTLVGRLARAPVAADRELLRDVALALGGELTLEDGHDVARSGAGTRTEAAELWAALAAPAVSETPAAADAATARAAWREAAFYSIWCLPDEAAEVARRRLADLDAVGGDAGDAIWKRRFDELRARWR